MNSRLTPPSQRRPYIHLVLAVVAAYVVNALAIAGTEQLLVGMSSGTRFYVADVATQCVIQIGCGYLCSRISKTTTAIVALIVVGLLIGSFSLVTSWRTEPHWYAIALITLYTPSVWIGHRIATGAAKLSI